MNLSKVPKIQDGVTTWSAAALNPTISALENNIAQVANAVDMFAGDAGYIFTDTGFSNDCKKGMLIAYDSDSARYIPAAAVWSENRAPNGGLIAAESAYVIGLLMTDIDKNRNGVIMAAGWTTNKEIIMAAAGVEAKPGRYYLSVGGKATLLSGGNSSILPVYCFSLTATGRLILQPQRPDVSNHAHTAHELTAANWKQKSSVSGSDAGSINDAQYVYDSAKDANLQDLLQTYNSGHSLVYDGKALASSEWGVTPKGYLYMKKQGSSNAKSTLYTDTPFFGVEPLIRAVGITSGNDVLKAEALDGTVMLDCEFPVTSTQHSATAVTGVNRTGITTSPMISTLQAGPGIVITDHTQPGGKTISSASVIGTLLDMIMVNANGVGLGGGPNQASVVFPAQTVSSALFAFRVPVTDQTLKGKLEACVYGTGAAINSFTADVSILKMPTKETPADEPTSTKVNISPVSSTNTGKIYLLESDEFNNLTGNAVVYFKLQADNPPNSIAVAAAGIRLSLQS